MSKEPKNLEQRDGFQSKWGFILACIGSAVGMGNIWRFPYEAGQHGGAAFILIYLLCVLFMGMPVMISEFLIGRRSRANTAGATASLHRVLPGVGWDSSAC